MAKGWATQHVTEARQALRVVVAALLALGVTRMFALPQGYWAVITAIIVIQASVGASLRTAVDRFMGSLLGASAGVGVAAVLPLNKTWGLGVALLVAVGPTAWFAAPRIRYRLAPITAAIVLLTATSTRETTMTLAFQRVAEILIGNVIGVSVATFVLPARAHAVVVNTAARVIVSIAELLDLYLGDTGNIDEQRVALLNAQARTALAELELAADEARLEVRSRLTDEPDVEPLVRAVRRLHNDALMIGRAAAQAAPIMYLVAQRQALRQCMGSFFTQLESSLRQRLPPPETTLVAERMRAYALEVERLRGENALQGLQGPQVARLYAMGFSLEQLALDVAQLSDRVRELCDVGDTVGSVSPKERDAKT